MKLRGLTKLALSGVALAAVAATLGTSTYAWYVSNTTASVTGAQGSTAGADTQGSLYAASPTMHQNNRWSNNIALGASDYTAANALVPVTKVTSAATSAFSATQASTWSAPTGEFADKSGADVSKANGAYLEFDFYLISRGQEDKMVGVTPTLTISNATSVFTTTQKAYTGSYLPGQSLATGSTFKVDAVHALRVEITNSAAATASTATTTTSITTVHSADSDFETYNSPSSFTPTTSTSDANNYYASLVNGVNLYGCSERTENEVKSLHGSTALPSNPWGVFYIKNEVETHLTFKVWLEGTDKDCWDSCVGQQFKFDFSFTLA